MLGSSLLGPQATGMPHCVFQKYSRAGSLKGGSWLGVLYVTSAIIENVWAGMVASFEDLCYL